MKNFTIQKRTFKALNYPKNSDIRNSLNTDSTTSEYMPSYKWVYKSENAELTFKTLKEAREYALKTDVAA